MTFLTPLFPQIWYMYTPLFRKNFISPYFLQFPIFSFILCFLPHSRVFASPYFDHDAFVHVLDTPNYIVLKSQLL